MVKAQGVWSPQGGPWTSLTPEPHLEGRAELGGDGLWGSREGLSKDRGLRRARAAV